MEEGRKAGSEAAGRDCTVAACLNKQLIVQIIIIKKCDYKMSTVL